MENGQNTSAENQAGTQTDPKVEDPKVEGKQPEQKPAEPPKPPEQKPKPRADPFEAAAATEKRLRQHEATLKQREAELQTRMAALEEQQKKLADLKTDPLGALERAGVSADELVKQIAGREPPKPGEEIKRLEQKLQAKIEAAEAEIKKQAQAQADALERARQEQFEAELAEFKRAAVSHVNANASKFELISAFGAQAYVPELILSYAKMHDKVLEFDEAAELIEKDLEAQLEKVAATNKAKAKFGAPAPKVEAKPDQKVEPQAQTSIAGAPPASSAALQGSQRELSEAERYEKAKEILAEHMKQLRG